MADDAKTEGDAKPDAGKGWLARRRAALLVSLAIAAVVLALAWLVWASGLLVESVTPAARHDVTEAIEETTDPAERARLRLELVALEQEDAVRRSGLLGTIAQVGTALLAGSAAAWGAVAAWRQLQDNRREAEAAQQRTDRQLQLAREELEDNRRQPEAAQRDTNEQLRLARDAQLTERYTRAVDQLGQKNRDVRLGGIYALERIAADSQMDLPTVVEVLAAFVRNHSPLPKSTDGDDVYARPEGGSPNERTEPRDLSRRAADVQVALTVLGRLKREPSLVIVDLTAADLRRADLYRANLTGANLRGANLEEAYLYGADLEGADLRGANLEEAYLDGANLEGAHLDGANLTGANLSDANLTGAKLERANLEGANLVFATLERVNLFFATLTGADLRGANLEEAYLYGAKLDRAALGRVRGARLEGARADSETTWPGDFDPEAAGVIFVDREEPPGDGEKPADAT